MHQRYKRTTMNEEQFIKERIGDGNPFKVPDRYFDSLTDSVMANVMANGKPVADAASKPAKTRTISVRLRRIMYAAACVAVVAVMSLTLVFNGDDEQKLAARSQKKTDATYTETTEIATVEEVADLAMMDNSDIYAYLCSDY